MKNVLISLILFFLFSASFAAAETLTRDVALSFILDDVEVNETYNQFLRLENLDHETGRTDSLLVNVSHYLLDVGKDVLASNQSHTRALNKFTETNMGTLFLEKNSSYQFCAQALPLNFEDYNMSNNEFCINFTFSANSSDVSENDSNSTHDNVTDEEEETCACELSIISQRLIEKGESFDITMEGCEDEGVYKHPVSYWVEDLFGTFVKTNITTSNPSPKTYTPRFDGEEKSVIIKATVPYCNLSASSIGTVRSTKLLPLQSDVRISATTTESTVFFELKGYRNETNREVIYVFLEKNGERVTNLYRYYIREKEQPFHIESQILFEKETGTYNLVAEGFGLRDETRISLKKTKETTLCPDVQEVPSLIASFYTRQRLYNEEINVFYTVNDAVDALYLHSLKDTVAIDKSGAASVRLSSANELLVLEAVQEDHKQYSLLRLNLTRNQEEPEAIQPEDELINDAEPTGVSSINNASDTDEVVNQTPSLLQADFDSYTQEENSQTLIYAGLIVLAAMLLFYKELKGFIKAMWIKYLKKTKLI